MEASQYLQSVIDVAIPRLARQGLGALCRAEQVVYLAWSYAGAVNNGGHASFFYNSYGEVAEETESALLELGLHDYAQILTRSIDQFPGRVVPRDSEMRNAAFDALPPHGHEAMEECDRRFLALGDERLFQQLLAYWRARNV